MSQPMDISIEQHHEGGEEDTHQSVGPKGVLQGTAHGLLFTAPEQASHDRSQPIRKSCGKDDDQVEHVIHEAGGGQAFGAVMAYHQRVGKA